MMIIENIVLIWLQLGFVECRECLEVFFNFIVIVVDKNSIMYHNHFNVNTNSNFSHMHKSSNDNM